MTCIKIPQFIMEMAQFQMRKMEWERKTQWEERPVEFRKYYISLINPIAPIIISDETFRNVRVKIKSGYCYNNNDKWNVTDFKVNDEPIEVRQKIEVGDKITFTIEYSSDDWRWEIEDGYIELLFGLEQKDKVIIPILN